MTATATALTVGVPAEPEPDLTAAELKLVDANVDLAAAFTPFPPPPAIPDISGGLGSSVYDFGQTAADVLLRAIVENFNLAALAQAAGADPETVLDTLLGGILDEIPADLLDDVIGALPIDISAVVAALIDPLGLTGPISDTLADLLALNLPDTLDGLLGLLGVDLSNALDLSNLEGPLNVITAGPVFTLLKLLGVDLGWVPGLPNSVAAEINNTEYLDLEVNLRALLYAVLPAALLQPIEGLIPGGFPTLDVAEIRIPVVVGFGLGAFAAGMAYQQVRDDLANQPGGPNAVEHPLLGSFTVLPMILLRNPGRGDGGLFARFYPLARLFGIDTVTPDTEVSSEGGIPILETGLSLGGANLIPLKIDATVMYDFFSDFAAWPNPFSLANNLMAGLLPTYILRGVTLDTIPEQLVDQIEDLLSGVLEGPLKLNVYLTLPTATLPLLEPLYLAADLVNLVTFGAASPFNPFSLIANALAPALTSLVNLGYTDVVFNPATGAYERTLLNPGEPTPFFSFPDVNWGQVPGVIINQLLQGIQKEFFSGNPTAGTPNVLTNLLNFLGGDLLGGLLPLGGLTSLLEGLLGSLNPAALTQAATEEDTLLASATSLPKPNARSFVLDTDVQGGDGPSEEKLDEKPAEKPAEIPADNVDDGANGEQVEENQEAGDDVVKVDAETPAPVEPKDPEPKNNPASTVVDTKDGNFTAPAPVGPRHAKPDNDSPTSTVDTKDGNFHAPAPVGPRHAKPDNDSPSPTVAGTATGTVDSNPTSNDAATGAAA